LDTYLQVTELDNIPMTDDSEAMEAARKEAEAVETQTKLFQGLKFFLGREVTTSLIQCSGSVRYRIFLKLWSGEPVNVYPVSYNFLLLRRDRIFKNLVPRKNFEFKICLPLYSKDYAGR
jgi:hypothetical protein